MFYEITFGQIVNLSAIKWIELKEGGYSIVLVSDYKYYKLDFEETRGLLRALTAFNKSKGIEQGFSHY